MFKKFQTINPFSLLQTLSTANIFRRSAQISLIEQRLKTFRPLTPSLRHTKLLNYKTLGIHKGKPFLKLTHGKREKAGKNNHGRTSVRYRGGGHKQRLRFVDFKRQKTEVAAVERIEYDPTRTGFVALLRYSDGDTSYILAPQSLTPGDKVVASSHKQVPLLPGNAMPIGLIPPLSSIHSIEMHPGQGGALVRAAGACGYVLSHDVDRKGYTLIVLPSNEHRLVPSTCLATIGSVSNLDHHNVSLGKAGRKRWMGIRPHVRGVAMNPIDHPMGGGEGKTSGGRSSCSPTGVLAKGARTRHSKERGADLVIKKRWVPSEIRLHKLG